MSVWPEVKIEDALDALIDYRGKSPKKASSGIPVISAKVVKSGHISDVIEQRISPNYYQEWMRRGIPQVGDVVLTTEGPLGEVARLDRESANFALGQRIVTLRGKSGYLDNGYLKYLLISQPIQDRLHGRATGSTVAGISQKSLREMEIPVAPIEEQCEIAAILGALDDKIELNRKTAATLEEMARALYRSWFVDFDPVRARAEGRSPAHMDAATAALFPDSFGEDGLPEGWAVKPYSYLIEILSGGTPKTSEPSFWGGSIPWYSVVDAPAAGQIFVHTTEKTITSEGLQNSPARIVPRGTTILSARGTVGKLAMAPSDMTFNQSCYGLRGRSKPLIAFTYFATFWAVDQLKSMAHGSVFSTITRQTFEGIELTSAPNQILDAFEEQVECWLSQIDNLGRQSHTLATLRDTLLPRLMSGELRVGAARELVEEVA
ncbi:restriction endonuclease subunit S [Brytella acorum]|uniref:restriction endonuclease subunit S n=1 Tax=Brytella acorum TaxID=2959299 RepID=UPI0025ADEA72|nr:restriction endonuclease subunit S [Brytella acorum]MDF3624095.1 restriction endonuclease subunit S [Brytella acorum]